MALTHRPLFASRGGLTACLAGFILVGYIAFLLSAHYASQIELQKARAEELRQKTEKLATTANYFFSERKNDLRDLGANRALSVFFQNKALGMSMEYGLRANLLSISEAFDQILNDKIVGRDHVYTRIMFVNSDGEVLTDNQPSTFEFGSVLRLDRLNELQALDVFVSADFIGDSGMVVICAPYFYKGKHVGKIVAWVSTDMLYNYILNVDPHSSDEMIFMITNNGGIIDHHETAAGLIEHSSLLELCRADSGMIRNASALKANGQEQEFVVCQSLLKEAPFRIVRITPVDKTTPPRQFLVAMGALSMFVLAGIAAAWRGSSRNLVLRARLEEIGKTQQEMETKNRQLVLEIAERRRAEQALKDSEKKYRLVVDNAREAIFIVHDGMVKFPNPVTESVTGHSVQELAQKSFSELIESERKTEVQERISRILGGQKEDSNFSFEIRSKNGNLRWLEANSILTEWEGQPAILFFAKDITVQKQLEAQLLHAHKMEAIGTLAGGIAHDFNNLLQAIHGYAELLLMSSENEKCQRGLNSILNSAKKGSELTRQLLTFSHKLDSKTVLVCLNQQILQMREILERTIPKMISAEFHLAEDLKSVNADASQIEQVLMNLAVNSRDAMPDGGSLVIETRNVVLDEQYATICGSTPGDYVVLSVSDTGHGIDKKIMNRIFEPFFTTKGVGRGSGLGLAMVYGIIASHKGFIRCLSEPGVGTVFKIYLPAIEGHNVPESPGEKPPQLKGGTETILIVDDEGPLREVGKEALNAYGYNVLTADCGEEAIKLVEAGQDNADLVLLDLIMPGMGGKDCLKELVRLRPDIRVIITSGYSPGGTTREFLEGLAKGILRKPYEIKELLKKIREVLSSEISEPC